MRILFVFFLILSTTVLQAQDKLTITLKNGRELSGFGKAKKFEVKFKPTKKGKYRIIKASNIQKVLVEGGKRKSKTHNLYIYRKLKKGKKPELVSPLYIEDDIELFVHQIKLSRTNKYGFTSETYIRRFFAIRKGELSPTLLFASNSILLKGYKKRMKDYFADCPSLIDKIGDKGYRRSMSDILNIVTYYDKNCNK